MDTKIYHKKNDNKDEQIKKVYAVLFYDAPDAIVMTDKNQCVMDINKKFEKIFDYKLKDIKGKNLDDLITKKDVLSEAKKITENLKNGKGENVESVRYDSNGNEIDVNIKISPIFIDNEVAGGYGIYADISERKKMERKMLAQNLEFKALFTNTNDAIVLVDLDDRVVKINAKFTELFGYKLKDIKGKKINSITGNKDIMDEMEKNAKLSLQGERVEVEGFRYGTNGKKVEVSIIGIPIYEKNKIIGVYSIYSDISKRKNAERELLNQNSKLKSLFENSTDAIVAVDSDDRITNINKNVTKLFGYKLKNIKGKKINSVIGKEDIMDEIVNISKRVLGGEKFKAEGIRYGKDGKGKEVSIIGIPIFDRNRVIGGYAVYSDISKRKNAERESLEQITKLNALFMNPVDGVVMVDEYSNIVNINSKFTKIFGYRLKDVKGKNINELLSDENYIEEARKLTKDSITESGITIETIRYGKDGKKKDVKITGMPIVVNGKVIGGYGMYTDISKRKQIEREFTDQSFRFKSLFMNSNNAIAMFDKNHNIININNRFTGLFGYELKDVKGKNLDSIVAKENVFKEANELTKNLLDGNRVNLETIRYGKDGKGIEVLVKGVPIIIDGEVIGGYGIYTDISEKKSVEREMLEQNLKFKSLFMNSTDAIALLDADEIVININDKFTELFGYEIEDSIGEKINCLIGNEDIMGEMEKLSNDISEGKELRVEGIRYGKDAKGKEVSIIGVPIIEDDKVVGVYAIYSDISERKRAERQLLEQNTKFKSLFMNSTDAIARIDEKFHIVDINNRFIELFGYQLEEIKGKNIDDVIGNESVMKEAKEITLKLSNGIQETVESVRFGKTGEKREVLIRGIPIIANDKVIGGYGIYTDISLRKSIEREIIYMSYHDELTGLYNRRFFEVELKRLDTTRNYPLSIVFADVNGLKNINDTCGHAKGDSLLKKAAKIIKREFRSDDIIARIGGDEFVAVIPRTEVEDVEKIIDRVNEACSKTFVGSMPISISFGIDSKTKPEQDILKIIKNAEDEMYNNKLIEKFNGE